jgi:type I restriction enzyme S subunit
MSAALRPYPEYRESGVDWLGRVPAHWIVDRAKANFREVDERSVTGEEELLSVSHKTGVTPRRFKNITMFKAASYAGYKLARSGDLVVNTMWAWMAALGVSQHDGIVSNAYGVYRPRDGAEMDGRYYDYLLRTEIYRSEYIRRSTGITTSRLRLYPPKLLAMPLIQPPPEEQRRIADFLDAYTAQVHRLIAAKRRTIAALVERKQAIIEGLLGAGVVQNSATVQHPVIGAIPSHWRVGRLKDWCQVNARTLPESTPGDYTFDYFDISAVGTGILSGEPQEIAFDAAPSRARRRLAPNDILISTVRTYLKAIYFFRDWPRDAVASTGFAVLTPKSGVNPELLAYALMTPRFIDGVISRSVGVAYPAIAETRLSALHLALPPDESEQQLILNAIKTDTKLVDEAIAKERSQIDLIVEYRDSLIAAVVTGQLDVREVAVRIVEGDDLADDTAADEEEMEDALDAVD